MNVDVNFDYTQLGVIIAAILGLIGTVFGNKARAILTNMGPVIGAIITLVSDLSPLLLDIAKATTMMQAVVSGIIELLNDLADMSKNFGTDPVKNQAMIEDFHKDVATLQASIDQNLLQVTQKDLQKLCMDLEAIFDTIEHIVPIPAEAKRSLKAAVGSCQIVGNQ